MRSKRCRIRSLVFLFDPIVFLHKGIYLFFNPLTHNPMKLSLMRKTKKLRHLTLAASSVLLITLTQSADAGVVWLASDTGGFLTLTATGSIDRGRLLGYSGSRKFDTGYFQSDSTIVYAWNGNYSYSTIGTLSGNDPWISSTLFADSILGTSQGFGHRNGQMYWDGNEIDVNYIVTPDIAMVFDTLTIATAFGSNLDAGPVLLWTCNATGDTISIEKVPEVSSMALLALGMVTFTMRRRK